MTVRFVCVWVGEKYDRRYPEILCDMILRNAAQLDEFGFYCLTDRPGELPEGIMPIPAHPDLPGWWQKPYMFSADMPWEIGDRIIYFDLDVAITGRLEDLAERSGIIRDWHWPMFNSSVMSWLHGEHANVWTDFTPEVMTRPSPPRIAALLPAGQINAGDQHWITECAGYVSEFGSYEPNGEGWNTFPPDWFVSYRYAKDWPPTGCKAVIFHGKTNPGDVADGWVPDVWKVGGYTSLPTMGGVNVTHDALLENIRTNVQRDLEWFTGWKPTKKPCVIVCGAPSMRDCLPEIRAHKRRGARIITVNNAWRFLVENGIVPDCHVMLDARPENAEFVKDAPAGVRYLIASQCHPDVFDALEGKEVVVWHNAFGDSAAIREVLAPWWDEGPNQRAIILVPGGGTVGLRAMWLAAFSGFRTLHLYGIDSSYAETGEHHAYPQPLNDGDRIREVVMPGLDGKEKRYRCAPWMVRQAEEFKTAWVDLKAEGVTLHVHGVGLIPDIAKKLKAEERKQAQAQRENAEP